jgi:hypothetical protein
VGGIPRAATGSGSYAVVLVTRGGRIPTKHISFDTHGLLVQLGVVPGHSLRVTERWVGAETSGRHSYGERGTERIFVKTTRTMTTSLRMDKVPRRNKRERVPACQIIANTACTMI